FAIKGVSPSVFSAAEQGGDALLVQLGANDHQLAAYVGLAGADLPLAGDVVELQPAVGAAVHDALGAEDGAVFAAFQLVQGVLDDGAGDGAGRLNAPAGEHLVGVVAVVVVMVAAVAMLMAVVVLVMILVVMVVVVMAAVPLLMLVVMMVVLLVLVLAVLVAVVVMVAAAAHAVLIVAVVMVVLVLFVLFIAVGGVGLGGHGQQLGHEIVLLGHGGQDLAAGQVVPGGGDDGG